MSDLTSAGRLVDRAVHGLESKGLVDRRTFLASGAALAACDSQGPRSAQRLLRFAERKNETVERWLLRHTAMDHARRGAHAAGMAFPAYHVAHVIPTWNEAQHGPWALEVSGLVRTPLRLMLDQLAA